MAWFGVTISQPSINATMLALPNREFGWILVEFMHTVEGMHILLKSSAQKNLFIFNTSSRVCMTLKITKRFVREYEQEKQDKESFPKRSIKTLINYYWGSNEQSLELILTGLMGELGSHINPKPVQPKSTIRNKLENLFQDPCLPA